MTQGELCGQSQAQPGETEPQSVPARPAGRPGPVAEQPLQCGELAQPRALQQEHLQVNTQSVVSAVRDFTVYTSSNVK